MFGTYFACRSTALKPALAKCCCACVAVGGKYAGDQQRAYARC